MLRRRDALHSGVCPFAVYPSASQRAPAYGRHTLSAHSRFLIVVSYGLKTIHYGLNKSKIPTINDCRP